MSKIQIAVTVRDADAVLTTPATLTSGTVGAAVAFSFVGEAWTALEKIAVFRAGSVCRDVAQGDWENGVCTIPWECLTTAGEHLLVGVYGTDAAGSVVIPTIYVDCGWIRPGADPTGDTAADPTAPFFMSLLEQTLAQASASGLFDGPAGEQGPQGEKGEKGDTGADGKDGTSYTIKGMYSTLAALKAAHPTGSAGDAWFVGTSESNVVYQWDVDQSAWVSVGALKGPQGDTGADGVGISSVAQTTTSTADGGSNVMTITLTDGTSAQFTVKNGSKGSTGATGAKGDTGATGATGAKGDKGDTGDTGEDGKSAYEAAQEGGYPGTEAAFNTALAEVENKADKSVTVSVTLAADWDTNAQTVSVSGVTATSNGSLRIAQSATDEEFAAWGAAQPRVTAQAAGSITVTLAGTVPDIDIPVEVLIV